MIALDLIHITPESLNNHQLRGQLQSRSGVGVGLQGKALGVPQERTWGSLGG